MNEREREKYTFFSLATNTFTEMNAGEKKLWYAVIFSVLYIYSSGFEAFTSHSNSNNNRKTNTALAVTKNRITTVEK